MPLYINRKMWTPCFASKQKAASEITATNVSKYDRIEGEKVWLYENNGSYTIVDALGLTSRAFTGVCKENIARNSSGTVEAVVDGELVVRWTRDFNTADDNNIIIDDNARTLYIKGGYSGAGIYKFVNSPFINATTQITTMIKIKLEAKSGKLESGFNISERQSSGSEGYPKYIDINYNHTNGGIYAFYKLSSSSGTFDKILDDNIIITNKWYWIKTEINNNTIKVSISEDNINWIQSFSKSSEQLFNLLLNSKFVGLSGVGDGPKITYDLAETWIKADDQIVWQPYAPITE